MIDNTYCSGCRDNFYNGNNQYGIKKCWNIKEAKIVSGKILPIDMTNPDEYLQRAESVRHPSCYRPHRAIFIKNKKEEKKP